MNLRFLFSSHSTVNNCHPKFSIVCIWAIRLTLPLSDYSFGNENSFELPYEDCISVFGARSMSTLKVRTAYANILITHMPYVEILNWRVFQCFLRIKSKKIKLIRFESNSLNWDTFLSNFPLCVIMCAFIF